MDLHPGSTSDAGISNMQELVPEWRRWVAENVLLKNDPASIVAAMVRDGINPAVAQREVRLALEHPYIKAAFQLATKNQPDLAAAGLSQS